MKYFCCALFLASTVYLYGQSPCISATDTDVLGRKIDDGEVVGKPKEISW